MPLLRGRTVAKAPALRASVPSLASLVPPAHGAAGGHTFATVFPAPQQLFAHPGSFLRLIGPFRKKYKWL